MWNKYKVNGKGQCPSRFVIVALLLVSVLSACASVFHKPDGLERIQQAGMLRIAIDPSFAPFEVINGKGYIEGFDADLATLIADHLGVQAHFVTTSYDALYDALTAGRADVIISALYPDPNRSDGFDFSQPYFDAGNVLLIPADAQINGPDDLAGTTLACQFGTDAHMQALAWQNELDPALTPLPMDDAAGIGQALLDGTAQAGLLDRVSAYAITNSHSELILLPQAISEEPYVVTTREQDRDLIKAIDDILQNLDEQGQIDGLIERWMH